MMSPATIVTGKNRTDMNNKYIAFGSYAMAYTETKNNMKRRSVPAIALNESNEAGGHYFMSLYTGKRIHAEDWDKQPIDDDVGMAIININPHRAEDIEASPLLDLEVIKIVSDCSEEYVSFILGEGCEL